MTALRPWNALFVLFFVVHISVTLSACHNAISEPEKASEVVYKMRYMCKGTTWVSRSSWVSSSSNLIRNARKACSAVEGCAVQMFESKSEAVIEAQNRVCLLRNFFTTIHFNLYCLVMSHRTFESQTLAGGELTNGSKWILTVLMALCIIARQSICRQKKSKPRNEWLAKIAIFIHLMSDVICHKMESNLHNRISRHMTRRGISCRLKEKVSASAKKSAQFFFVLRWNENYEITTSTEAGQGWRKSRYRWSF